LSSLKQKAEIQHIPVAKGRGCGVEEAEIHDGTMEIQEELSLGGGETPIGLCIE
jgi:hypothetical protein